jgi:hypothetical protein
MLKLIRRLLVRGEYFAAPVLFVGRAAWWRRPILATMRWASPDGRATAHLEVPRDNPEDDLLWIKFDGDRAAVENLTHQPLWLGGRWGYVHHPGAGVVDLFDLQAALRHHQPLTLEVGETRERWQPID